MKSIIRYLYAATLTASVVGSAVFAMLIFTFAPQETFSADCKWARDRCFNCYCSQDDIIRCCMDCCPQVFE